MNRLLIPLALFPFLLLFSQCEQSSAETSYLVLPERGSWFSRGESISLISVSREKRKAPGRISCRLEQDGRILFSEEYFYDELISLPIPLETESGLLNVIWSDDSGKGSNAEVYYLEREYGVAEVAFYPPVPMAGSIVEAFCQVDDMPGDSFLRWKLGGRIISEGYLSSGADRICFYGPEQKGHYTLKVEIFPEQPLGRGENSPWSGAAEIFFDEIPDKEGSLAPEEWIHLFDCDGTNIDKGRARNFAENDGALSYLSSSGLEPVMREADRGYGFSSDSTLMYDGKILQGEGFALSRVTARLSLSEPEDKNGTQPEQIFNTRDGTGDFGFSLFRKGNSLLLSFQCGSDRFIRSFLEFGDDLYGRPFRLAVEVEQIPENLLIRWYLDGILEKEELFENIVLPPVYQAGGKSLWGGGDMGYSSFVGVLFDWGFTHDSDSLRRFD